MRLGACSAANLRFEGKLLPLLLLLLLLGSRIAMQLVVLLALPLRVLAPPQVVLSPRVRQEVVLLG